MNNTLETVGANPTVNRRQALMLVLSTAAAGLGLSACGGGGGGGATNTEIGTPTADTGSGSVAPDNGNGSLGTVRVDWRDLMKLNINDADTITTNVKDGPVVQVGGHTLQIAPNGQIASVDGGTSFIFWDGAPHTLDTGEIMTSSRVAMSKILNPTSGESFVLDWNNGAEVIYDTNGSGALNWVSTGDNHARIYVADQALDIGDPAWQRIAMGSFGPDPVREFNGIRWPVVIDYDPPTDSWEFYKNNQAL